MQEVTECATMLLQCMPPRDARCEYLRWVDSDTQLQSLALHGCNGAGWSDGAWQHLDLAASLAYAPHDCVDSGHLKCNVRGRDAVQVRLVEGNRARVLHVILVPGDMQIRQSEDGCEHCVQV